MSKVAVVFWSGTGNTEEMAKAVVEGVNGAGSEGVTLSCGEFNSDSVGDYDAFAFGCPSCGAETLEESEFEPMWDAVKSSLSGKKVVLFGSFGWGGDWIDTWKEDAESAGITVVDTFICNGAPDDDSVTACKNLGAALV